MKEEILLGKLADKRAQYSVSALLSPQQRDQFEYGERVGFIRGLTAAIELITQTLKEERDNAREDDLTE